MVSPVLSDLNKEKNIPIIIVIGARNSNPKKERRVIMLSVSYNDSLPVPLFYFEKYGYGKKAAKTT
ncbi:hypothetical protein [Amphibiibacter pelophylacis]|uniref:Uncharacterized protein n=1 Tax=Amphibiibacter pelophylacis TaxID=1799477 RepID=A0ACC6P275_9BURK